MRLARSVLGLAVVLPVAVTLATPAAASAAQEVVTSAGPLAKISSHAFSVDASAPADTTAPAVTIDQPAEGASLTDQRPLLAGHAGTAGGDAGTVGVELHRGTTTTGPTTWSGLVEVHDGRWRIYPPELAYGHYTLLVRQRDAAGNEGVSAPRRFTIDSPAGADLEVSISSTPLPVLVGRPLTYTVKVHNHGPDDATGVRLAALLPVGADLPAHESFAVSPPGCSRSGRTMTCFAGLLTAGQTLTYRFVATPRRAGSMDARVSAVAAQSDPVESSNRGTAELTAVRTPTLAKTIVAARVRGTVRIRRRGQRRFRGLTTESLIPVGSLVDATHGRVRITSRRRPGGPLQTADFYQGEFLLRQVRSGHGLTLLDLRGGGFAGCPRRAPSSTTAHVARRRPRRRLWGSGHGSFRTRGRFGSATVRGTIWYTQDRCHATYFKTRRGVVAVRNYVERKTVKVPAGHSYYARAPRP